MLCEVLLDCDTFVYCCCGHRINVNITLFLRVTLISKVQSTSDLDCFHARDRPCLRVKSHDDTVEEIAQKDFLYILLYIHCVPKNVENDFFWISQGKVATVYR